MTSMTRRGFATLSGLAMASIAAGCGRSSSPQAASTTGAKIKQGKATGNLTIWAMGAEEGRLPALLKKFTAQNPDCNITMTPIPWSSAHGKITSAIAGGTTPDLTQIGNTWMSEFVGLEAFDPAPSSIDMARFFEGSRKKSVFHGTTYGVPWYVETRCVFWRKDLAREAGITKAPQTWEEFKALARAYKKAGAKFGVSLPPGGQGSWQAYVPIMWSNGGKLMNNDEKTFTLDDPRNIEALSYYQSFFTEGLASTASSSAPAGAEFADGSVPMFISGPFMIDTIEKAGGGEKLKEKYGVFLIPKKVSSISLLGGSSLAVLKTTKNRDSAWKLVEFLTNIQTQLEWYKDSGELPSIKDAWQDPSLTSNEKMAVFGKQLKSAATSPTISTWEQVASKMDAQVEKVCRSGLTPAQALKTAQNEATSIGVG